MWWHGHDNAVLIFWTAIAIIVVARGYFRSQARMAKYRAMERMAEKGQPIPPEMVRETRYTAWDQGWERDREWETHFSVGSGVMLMCIGVALGVFFWALGGGGGFFQGEDVPHWLPFVGLFPFMIGFGRIIVAVTAPRREGPK